ncbi:MAG: pantoate--beta-alanine ligase [Alphaproteobacteria bacterium]|nr:pantoate--beta-alanine ligase [Alphaproteobacteria bacterium]
MKIIKTLKELRSYRNEVSGSVGLVPTMGALHEGHLSLVKKSFTDNNKTIVSIFVNPAQFAPHEDFDSYPRHFEDDCKQLERLNVDAVWAPSVSEMYPKDFQTAVRVSGISEVLEGEFRPHFFEGVTTIVNKLFMQVQPTRAYFGEKVFQQLQVIQKMVKDLNISVHVIGCKIIRDAEGLALSSRNAYLSDDDIQVARQLNVILKQASALVKERGIQEVELILKDAIITAGFTKVDYVTLRNAETLRPISSLQNCDDVRILVAAYLGPVRLIDNIGL